MTINWDLVLCVIFLACIGVIMKNLMRDKKRKCASKAEKLNAKNWWKNNGGVVGMAMFKSGAKIATMVGSEAEGGEKFYCIDFCDGNKVRWVTPWYTIEDFVSLVRKFEDDTFESVFYKVAYRPKTRKVKNATFKMYGAGDE